jgi:hypothetical protein
MRKLMLFMFAAMAVSCSKSSKEIDVIDTWKVTRYTVDSCPKYAIYSGKHVRVMTNVQVIADKPESEMKAYVTAVTVPYYEANFNYGGDTVNYRRSWAKYQHN